MSPRRQNPMLSVDVVALRLIEVKGKPRLTVGLGRRIFEPHLGELALPGVLMLADERVAQAAHRAVVTKLGVAAASISAVSTGQVFDTPERDERGPTVSIGCTAVVNTADAGTATWVGFDDVGALPFDHARIIAETRAELRQRIWDSPALINALFGIEFTTLQMTMLNDAIHGRPSNPSNTGRRLAQVDWAVPGEPQQVGVGRPRSTWTIRHNRAK